eukprot:CAMPEP_0115844050 /NCGR_PEP_ID=MMETSP0287-20121206/8631_1 /TAXON_ID=412157 /ORGANISM="Chrysochromulina rotalis, Strain UIO044" /LENGTH=88 /DNA_ID=CAMNT_0003297769 /DNA_START=352 /DNA_END=615 /DNA_ORIENTATION=-
MAEVMLPGGARHDGDLPCPIAKQGTPEIDDQTGSDRGRAASLHGAHMHSQTGSDRGRAASLHGAHMHSQTGSDRGRAASLHGAHMHSQ